jgi:hypothetical protein
MAFNFSFGFGNRQKRNFDVDKDGNVFYSLFNGFGGLANRISDREKLKKVCENPALLKVISLDCDIFSLGKVNKFEEGKLIEEDFLYSLVKKPNLMQSWTSFFWDYKWWLNVCGTSVLYNPNNSKNIGNTSLQFLNPANITYNDTLIRKLQKFIFSNLSYNEVLEGSISYKFDNGESKDILLKELEFFHDLTNAGQSNPLKGISRIDALYKVINNSELALDAKGINLFLAGKFMVAGKADPSKTDFSNIPMSEDEKLSIENKVLSNKSIHAVKSMIGIKRFVENMGALKLDESFVADYFMFGSMFNIPRDILETSLRGSTYENQEKAMARLIEYCEKPKAQKLTDWFETQFDLQDIRMSWNHLMFMKIFEKEQINNQKLKASALLELMKAGVKLDEINTMLETNFSSLDYEGLKKIPSNNNI